MISSVLNEGLRGLQHSQREMAKSAHEIAQFNVRDDNLEASSLQNPEDVLIEPVNRPEQNANSGDIAEPIIELKRQELLFTASAKVVSVADQTLGSLLDVKS